VAAVAREQRSGSGVARGAACQGLKLQVAASVFAVSVAGKTWF
jgi:hypothetical protein